MPVDIEVSAREPERRHHVVEFIRYFAVSAIALGVDMLLLLLFAQWMHYTLAASISFMVGAGIHYLLSVAFVFRRRKMRSRRFVEAAIFTATGLAALVINVGVIALCVELLAAPLPLAKLAAAGVSFLFGYGVRKRVLF